MHEVSTSRKAAISENNATIEDLKNAQDDVLPAVQGKMALVSTKKTYQGHRKAACSWDI